MEESFIINDQVVMFIENTKTHRVRIIWDVAEFETSLAKAKEIHKFLQSFTKGTESEGNKGNAGTRR